MSIFGFCILHLKFGLVIVMLRLIAYLNELKHCAPKLTLRGLLTLELQQAWLGIYHDTQICLKNYLKIKEIWHRTKYKMAAKKIQLFLHLGESMIKYTTKVVMSDCNRIFIHECKKIKLSLFQSLSNRHGAQY
jgi:hypothetical protein